MNDLAAKIAEAKQRLPLPVLMMRLGLGEHAKKSAHCPFHSDKHSSFSVFQGKDGFFHYKCFASCGEGDEIMFLRKWKGLSLSGAMSLYLDMAGFPPSRPLKSHEYPKSLRSPEFPESPEYHVHPMSNGQRLEKELEGLATSNACTERGTARKRRWQLARDLRAVEGRIARQLSNGELMQVFNEWSRLSQAFLDPAKTRDVYLAAFLAELGKVRIPTGEGETIKKAREHISALPVSELPMIAGMPDPPESWRRLAALHRELSRRSGGNTYFLSCRDAAKVSPGLSYQGACDINRALERFGVIKIVRVGDARPNGKASQFRYLLPETENGTPQTENRMSKAKKPEAAQKNRAMPSSW